MKSTYIGYFDQNFDDNERLTNTGKHVFYKDVYAFIDKFQDVPVIYGMAKIKKVMSTCSRDGDFSWHPMELTDLEKGLFHTSCIEQCYEALAKRFRKTNL